MKMCDECGINLANIHLTQIMESKTESCHICQACAEKRGITINVQEEIEFSGPNVGALPVEPQTPDRECADCGMKFSDFKSSGLLGCAACYSVFENEINEILVEVHGSVEHKGKRYSPFCDGTQDGVAHDVSALRNLLDKAIKNEEYEQAAVLRDAILERKNSDR